MNTEQLEVNIKAAMLYSKTKPLTRRGKCYVSMNPFEAMYISIELEVDNVLYREFNIFTNAQDLLDMVKKLGEHDIDILSYNLENGQNWKARYNMEGLSKLCSTYEEAVAAAVMEVVQ